MFAVTIRKMCGHAKKHNPVSRVSRAWRRWRNTKVYMRYTIDAHGVEHMYEFVLVPRDEKDVFSLHISKFDLQARKGHLVERLITATEFEALRPKLTEI